MTDDTLKVCATCNLPIEPYETNTREHPDGPVQFSHSQERCIFLLKKKVEAQSKIIQLYSSDMRYAISGFKLAKKVLSLVGEKPTEKRLAQKQCAIEACDWRAASLKRHLKWIQGG